MIPTEMYDGGMIWKGFAPPMQRGHTVEFMDGPLYIVEKSPEWKQVHDGWIQKVCLLPTFNKEECEGE